MSVSNASRVMLEEATKLLCCCVPMGLAGTRREGAGHVMMYFDASTSTLQ